MNNVSHRNTIHTANQNRYHWRAISTMARYIVFIGFVLGLTACFKPDEKQQAHEVAAQFWQAVLYQDMEQAKNLVTWESVSYLNLLEEKKYLGIKAFEVGEIKKSTDRMDVAVTLKATDKQGGEVSIPINTILLKQGDEQWRVDARETTRNLVSGSLDSLADEFGTLMQKSMDQLDQSLQEGAKQLEGILQKGLQELNKHLEERQQKQQEQAPTPSMPGQAI